VFVQRPRCPRAVTFTCPQPSCNGSMRAGPDLPQDTASLGASAGRDGDVATIMSIISFLLTTTTAAAAAAAAAARPTGGQTRGRWWADEYTVPCSRVLPTSALRAIAAGSAASMHLHPAAVADYMHVRDPDAGSVGAPAARAVVHQARVMSSVGPALPARWGVKV